MAANDGSTPQHETNHSQDGGGVSCNAFQAHGFLRTTELMELEGGRPPEDPTAYPFTERATAVRTMHRFLTEGMVSHERRLPQREKIKVSSRKAVMIAAAPSVHQAAPFTP